MANVYADIAGFKVRLGKKTILQLFDDDNIGDYTTAIDLLIQEILDDAAVRADNILKTAYVLPLTLTADIRTVARDVYRLATVFAYERRLPVDDRITGLEDTAMESLQSLTDINGDNQLGTGFNNQTDPKATVYNTESGDMETPEGMKDSMGDQNLWLSSVTGLNDPIIQLTVCSNATLL